MITQLCTHETTSVRHLSCRGLGAASRISVCFAVVAVVTPAVASAQTSSLTGQFSTSTGITDNANLEAEDQAVGDAFSTLTPGVIYTRLGRRVIHVLSYRFDYQLYFQSSQANSYSNQVNWGGAFLLSRKLRVSLSADLSQGDTSNFSLVSDQGIADAGNDGGVTFVSASAGQGLSWDINPVWQVQETLGVRTFLPLDSVVPRSDSYDISSALAAERRWQQTAVGARYNTNLFIGLDETDDAGNVVVEGQKQLITGPELVLRRDIGPQWGIELSGGGVGITKLDNSNATGILYQPTGGAALRYTTLNGSARVGYGRNVAPNVEVGEVFVNDQVDLTGDYPLLRDERVFLRGGIGFQRGREIDPVGEAVGGSSFVYLADASVGWEVRDNLALALRYQYRDQDADESSSSLRSFTSNTVLVTVGGTYPSSRRRTNPLRNPQRVDGSDAEDPFGNVNGEKPRPRR